MRLSGFSPSGFTAPRDAESPGKNAAAPLQTSAKGGPANGLAFVAPQRQNIVGSLPTPRQSADLPQSNALADTPLLGQLIASLFGDLLSSITGSGVTAWPQSGGEQGVSGAQGGPMSFEQAITTLGRHEDLLKKPQDREGLAKLRDDPQTPSDAKKALDTLLNNPDRKSVV